MHFLDRGPTFAAAKRFDRLHYGLGLRRNLYPYGLPLYGEAVADKTTHRKQGGQDKMRTIRREYQRQDELHRTFPFNNFCFVNSNKAAEVGRKSAGFGLPPEGIAPNRRGFQRIALSLSKSLTGGKI
jgi:hypothetical protein